MGLLFHGIPGTGKTSMAFAIKNKYQTTKDNTRDFLILHELVKLCKMKPKDKVIYISNDKIFKENQVFTEYLNTNSINNLVIYNSISKYLMEYGYIVDFLTDEIVLNSVPYDTIREEILKNIGCFPSHVSKYYRDDINVPDLEMLDIPNVKLNDYYTIINEDDTHEIVMSILVHTVAVYFPEQNVDLTKYDKAWSATRSKTRIDELNRPIYDDEIIFIFQGQVNVDQQSITNNTFVDFLP